MFRFRTVVWSPVELDYLKAHKKDSVNQLTIALAKSRNAIKNKIKELEGKSPKKANKKDGAHQTFKIGKRKDCNNLFFRSAYEANVYRWMMHTRLHHMHGGLVKVEYEPECFGYFEFGHKTGTTSYIPDFRITFHDGTILWLEVKGGYMKGTDKTKIRRFKKYYPKEFERLTFLTNNVNSKSAQFFLSMKIPPLAYYHQLRSEFADIIPNWE